MVNEGRVPTINLRPDLHPIQSVQKLSRVICIVDEDNEGVVEIC
jgi:hypothetical protein